METNRIRDGPGLCCTEGALSITHKAPSKDIHTAFCMAIIVMFKKEKPSISDLNQYQKAAASVDGPTNQIEIKESA